MITIQTIKEQLTQNQPLVDDILHLNLAHCGIQIHSNSQALLDKLRVYFKSCNVVDDKEEISTAVNIPIIAIESQPPELGINFIDWKREPGKKGRKDEYFDFTNSDGKQGRVVRKVRTGMVFLQSEQELIAAGPSIQYDNQVINYINSQYMNWLQNNGWRICHASGLVANHSETPKGIAIAGLSGGGKSTLMLEILNNEDIAYVTNDRLFIKQGQGEQGNQVGMLGIPKLPRINPGTIVGNPLLHGLLDPQQLSHYEAMERQELWDIEEKNDVPVADVYGEDSVQSGGNLSAFILLNWHRDGDEPVSLLEVDIQQRRDLLPAIMKSPGPFYQYTDGHFEQDTAEFDEEAYLQSLKGVKIYEAKGTIDFTKMSELCMEVITSQ